MNLVSFHFYIKILQFFSIQTSHSFFLRIEIDCEENAIYFRTSENLKGAEMYSTESPCVDCAKLFRQCGIKAVHCISKEGSEAAEKILKIRPMIKFGETKPNNEKINTLWKELKKKKQSDLVTRIDREDYFMGIALIGALRSEDPITKVGACIVDSDNRIVGIGWNGVTVGDKDVEKIYDKQSKKENGITNYSHLDS